MIIKRKNETEFVVSSPYWDDDIGKFENGFITWERHGKGKIFFTHIDNGNENIWHRDTRIK